MDFHRTVDTLVAGSDHVPLVDHNESVCRFSFCRGVAHTSPEIQQHAEAGRIDLVLKDSDVDELAFIEFKFYVRRPRLPADGSPARGDKGGPSDKDRREFTDSIDRLSAHPDLHGLSRCIVTFYADPPAGEPSSRRFSDYLGL